MGRRPREYLVDQIYHLTARGIEERAIFADDEDRQAFAIRLRRVLLRHGLRLHAACLMDSHYHVVVPGSARIDAAMRDLNSGHARAFNERHGRRGSLFEQRYTDTPMRDEEHFATTVEYVLTNPVKADMVERVEDWPWSTWEGSALSTVLARCLTPIGVRHL